MNQERFEQAHREQWTAFEAMVAPGQSHAQVAEQLPEAYRRICQHLALARDRGYSVGLVGRLNRLVLAGHQTLYGSSLGLGPPWGRFLAGGLAVSVRTLAKPVLLAAALLGLPFAILPVAIARHPGLAYRVVAPQQLAHMEAMYQPRAGRFGRANQAQADVQMFGFYIWNNVRITFQTFASGIFLGLGSVFYLLFNGIHGGAVAGHLTHAGLGPQFWPFVATHSALELTSLVLAGGAGLHLGWALVAPGRRTRGRALREAVRDGMPLVYGAALMDVLAAFIEAFWSASALVPAWVKLSAAALLWTAVATYLLLAGRRHA